jgi:type I restriction enzyme M protein
MNDQDQKQLGKTLWNIADQLRGAMNADDFRDYTLSFLFLRYLSHNYDATQNSMLSTLKAHKKGLMQQLFPSPEEAEA